jgi:flagellar hook-basal body complex protein FliE
MNVNYLETIFNRVNESLATPRFVELPNKQNDRNEAPAVNRSRETFDAVFQAALDLVNETNRYQHVADIAQVNFATGQDTNILNLIMAQERAASSLNFTVQVTNKIIESYREIMRMTV